MRISLLDQILANQNFSNLFKQKVNITTLEGGVSSIKVSEGKKISGIASNVKNGLFSFEKLKNGNFQYFPLLKEKKPIYDFCSVPEIGIIYADLDSKTYKLSGIEFDNEELELSWAGLENHESIGNLIFSYWEGELIFLRKNSYQFYFLYKYDQKDILDGSKIKNELESNYFHKNYKVEQFPSIENENLEKKEILKILPLENKNKFIVVYKSGKISFCHFEFSKIRNKRNYFLLGEELNLNIEGILTSSGINSQLRFLIFNSYVKKDNIFYNNILVYKFDGSNSSKVKKIELKAKKGFPSHPCKLILKISSICILPEFSSKF